MIRLPGIKVPTSPKASRDPDSRQRREVGTSRHRRIALKGQHGALPKRSRQRGGPPVSCLLSTVYWKRRGGRPVSCFLSTVYWGRPAFTLVELLVVIGILLILFNLLMVPMMMGLRLTSSTRRAVEAQDRARMAIEQMRKDVGRAMLVLPASPWETTSLANALPEGEAATMAVLDARRFPPDGLLPDGGGVVVVGLVPFGAELIAYTSRTGATLEGLSRGYGGSTPIDHPAGSRVSLVKSFDPTYPDPSGDEFTASRIDLIMPKTDFQGKAIQPLSHDPIIIRYYIAPARRNASMTEGWPKYWNPFQFPSVGVQPDRGTSPCFYVLYRVRFDLERLQNDPTYLLYGSDPWKVDFYDDARPSPAPFGTQAASYSFWWRKMSIALTPVESGDAALYVRMSAAQAAERKDEERARWGLAKVFGVEGLSKHAELRPLEKWLTPPIGEWVAPPGFSVLPARREREQLVPNDREEPTRYFGSLSLWSEWPVPRAILRNDSPSPPLEQLFDFGDAGAAAFLTWDPTNGRVDFVLSRTEYLDGDGAGTPAGDGALLQDPDAVGAYNVYEVSLVKDPTFDRGGPSDALGNPIADFVLVPRSEKVTIRVPQYNASGDFTGYDIEDYTRSLQPGPALIERDSYYIDYVAGRITFTQGFNDPLIDPATGLPYDPPRYPNDIMIQFQYRRNLLKDAAGNVTNDNVLATYSSLAMIDVRLIIASYSQSRVPTDEFRLATRLEVGNAPR